MTGTSSIRPWLRTYRAVALASVLASGTLGPPPAFAAGTAPAPPASIVVLDDAYVAAAMRADPLFADQLGVHRYDDRLADLSEAGQAQRVASLRAWRTRLASALGPAAPLGARADTTALLDAIDLELFEDATVAPLHRDPTTYTGILGQAVYALLGRHDGVPDVRLRSVAARLRLVPRVVAAAEANLTRPPRVATLQAIDENGGNVALYAALTAESAHARPATRQAIAAALPAALGAIRSFTTYLRTTLLPRSDGESRVGRHVYDRELLLADGTLATRAQLVAAARAHFASDRAEMLRLALPYDRVFFPHGVTAERGPNATDVVVRRVLDRLASDHPQRTGIFAAARRDVARSETFLERDPIVVLPRPNSLRVVPTPAFMAGFSGASMNPAGPFTPLAASYYYIDEIPAAWNAARVASYLRDYNDYELVLLSMHEAVPGHYVQFRYNDENPSLVRRTFSNGSFAEGWAVWTEGMMLDAGYGGRDPRLRLFQLKWRLREEANAIVDAAYHTGSLTRAQCFALLERHAFQEHAEVETKWHRLQLSHDQLTSYFVGLTAIRAVRARHPELSTSAFNAALLRMGSVEPRFIGPLIDAPVSP